MHSMDQKLSVKLAQRKAYRESLVKQASSTKTTITANRSTKTKAVADNGFVKISELNHRAKAAFAEKALAEGFPSEYVNAVLGEAFNSAEKTEEIKIGFRIIFQSKKTTLTAKEIDVVYTNIVNKTLGIKGITIPGI